MVIIIYENDTNTKQRNMLGEKPLPTASKVLELLLKEVIISIIE